MKSHSACFAASNTTVHLTLAIWQFCCT